MKRGFAASLVLALLLARGAAFGQDHADARADRVRALFSDIETRPSPGLAFAVVREGEVLLSGGHGLANLEHRVAITSSTVFDVASLSKQFTGLAIAMLVEQGRIGLHDDIRDYIPELPDFGSVITIAHLVHHTSGLRDWPGTLAIAGWRFDDVISYEQILRMAYAQHALNFEPGSEHTYSNTGYTLLAELVSRVTARSFRSWMDEHVFRPLGMADTHVHDDHTEVVANRAYGYSPGSAGSHRHTPNNLTALGSSSLFSTADDLARWLINFERPTVGGGSVQSLMHTRGVLNDGSTIPYAFGISHGSYRGLPTVSHSGSWASFRTYLVHFPEQRFGAVVLANGGATDATRAAHDIVDIFLADELGPGETAEAPTVQAPAIPAVPDDYVGLYRLGPGRYLRIRRTATGLAIRATSENEFRLARRSEAEFQVEGHGASVVFVRDAGGQVRHLRYRGTLAPKLEHREPPSSTELAEFAGEYLSEELRTAYTVEVENGALVMRHPRHGTLPLTHAWSDEFTGSASFLTSIEFQRDEAGRVIGLLVGAGPRNRDLRFVKRPQ
jgi:CubicO group peptidase (beta-lactamase class C family)